MTRNEAREIMMQILYEIDVRKEITKDEAKKMVEDLSNERLAGGHIERGKSILFYIIENIEEIDSDINRCSTKWKSTRMPKVDLAIMRLASGEIRYSDDIPVAVSVNEAINLARKFSTENSARFIHGILGSLTKLDK